MSNSDSRSFAAVGAMRFLRERSEWVVPAVFVLNIAVAMYLLLMSDLGAASGTLIGHVQSIQREVTRKQTAQAIWGTLSKEASLFEGDVIRTDALSGTVIELTNGTRIEIGEETLVVLRFSEFLEIELVEGSLNMTGESAPGEISAVVRSGNDSIDLESGTTSVRRDRDGSTDVDVYEGNARLRSGDDTVELNAGDSVESDGRASEIKRDGNTRLIDPPPGAVISSEAARPEVDFAWQVTPGSEDSSASKQVLRIARDGNMQQVIRRFPAETTVNKMRLKLPPGTYYWNVKRTHGGGTTADSEVRRIVIEPPRSVALQGPPPGSTVDADPDTGKKRMLFRWEERPELIPYKLQVDDNPEFPSPEEVTVFRNSYTMELEPGEYHWRVSDARQVTIASRARKLTVRAAEKRATPPPRLLLPRARRCIRCAGSKVGSVGS